MTTTPAASSTIPSPCIQVCKIDAETGLCRGCLRTVPEIKAWKTAGDAEREAILAAAAARR